MAKSTRPIKFGEITGVPEGARFENRREMMPSSFHRNHGTGIDGNGKEGAAAIVLSGGYEDDQDFGDEIVYTGQGGWDSSKKVQVSDQSWDERGNAALLRSADDGLPVRVIRGHQHKSPWSPGEGYIYSGLYSVVEAWQERGKSGFLICRFRLIYEGGEYKPSNDREVHLDTRVRAKQRKSGTVTRVVRDSMISIQLKRLYDYQCQICGLAIETKKGFYAEGAHVRPLGAPHDGDDSTTNLLCLCPNHHVMLDKGSFSIADDLSLLGAIKGHLNLHPAHDIDHGNLKYHRSSHGFD